MCYKLLYDTIVELLNRKYEKIVCAMYADNTIKKIIVYYAQKIKPSSKHILI